MNVNVTATGPVELDGEQRDLIENNLLSSFTEEQVGYFLGMSHYQRQLVLEYVQAGGCFGNINSS